MNRPLKKVGILFHPRIAVAQELTQRLAETLSGTASVWVCSAWEEEEARAKMAGTELVFSIGGDGTMLRAARIVVPNEAPILGINMGRLGFMTELSAAEAVERAVELVGGGGWLDERAMLQAEVEGAPILHALNDVAVVRGGRSRVVYVRTAIDGASLATYRGDGLIVATATGSTGYALAAGGPILYPQSKELLLQPVAAHLSLTTTLILPPEATVDLQVATDHQALLSIDGQVEVPLDDGARVRVKRSPHISRLLRVRPATSFYETLAQKLSNKKDWK